MKKLSTLCMVAALLVGGWTGCTDEKKEIIGVDVVESYDISFEIKDQKLTSTSYTFEVTPSDLQSPYVCLYVDKSVIDRVPKQDLPKFLLNELKKNAQAENKPWQEYLPTLLVTGQTTKTINNLLPGNMYELVVFGVRGEQLSQSAGYRFFETLKADPVQMTFDIKVDASKHTEVNLEVTPSLKDKMWYLCSFTKDQYDKLKAAGLGDAQMSQAYLNEEFRQFLRVTPNPTKEQLDSFIKEKFHTGDQKLKLSGRALKADTGYVYLVTGVFITPKYEIVFISATKQGVFKTAQVPQKGTTFKLEVKDIGRTSAAISITPSDLTQKYVWRCEAYNEGTLKMSADELARYVVNTNPYIFFEAFPHRNISYPTRKLVPGTKHFLLAFGYEGGICTKVFREDITPQDPGDPTTVNFTVTKGKITTDKAELKITPSDNSIYYIPLLFPDTKDKESVKGRLIAGFRRNVEQTRQSGFNPHADLWDVIAQQATLGEEEFSWSSLEPSQSHTLLILTFKKDGIAGERFLQKGYVQVPGFSNDKVGEMTVAGIFDGDEEKGEVFKQPDAVKGKVILALKYKVDPVIKEAYSAINVDQADINELDPNVISDAEILNNGSLRWITMNVKAPYQFVLTTWSTPQISYSYGINDKSERGPIARATVPGAEKSQKMSIEELKKLVAEADGKTSSNSTLLRTLAPAWDLQKLQSIDAYIPTRVSAKLATTVAVPMSPAMTVEQSKAHSAELNIPLVRAVK